MRLADLVETYRGDFNPEIKGLTHDSRQVREGWLFAALPGVREDGARYIVDAIRHGAVAILAQPGTRIEETGEQVALVTHENPRRALAQIAARFYGKQPEFTVAVTGTNGKTSTVDFTRQLWQGLGLKAASLGTLGVRGPGVTKSGSLTTPDPVALQADLADLAAAGVTHLAMEASSHGLHQSRLDGVRASAAGFTNLSHDHLDYHNTMEDYLIAKAHLFAEILQPGGTAVLNADIPEFAELRARVEGRDCRLISYGWQGQDIKITGLTPTPAGQHLEIDVCGQSHQIDLPLVGEFQVMNALCALGLVIAGSPDSAEQAIKLLPTLKGVPGRLELVPGHPKGGAVYVDYAHTPDALENILKALRPHTHGRLLCIIGCGGDRDARKRPIMGKIAATRADLAIITDDNPRSEDPAPIRRAMMAGAQGAENIREIGDRREAIRWAINEMKEGDVLVIAGKGHEQGQIIGDTVEPFDDVTEAKQAMGTA